MGNVIAPPLIPNDRFLEFRRSGLANLFPDELDTFNRAIISNLKSLHISCGRNCLEVTKSNSDFIGICIFHSDGDQVIQDAGGNRVRSGYIFAEPRSALDRPPPTLHRQTYDKVFRDIENHPGVVIVGFSQQDRKLKGTSGTFNSENGNRECLFSYRILIFGAIIMHKVNGVRNISPYSACLCICLFLVMKKQGDSYATQNFPIWDIELDHQEVFLENAFRGLGLSDSIVDVAFGRVSTFGIVTNALTFGALEWGNSQLAIYEIMKGLKADMSESEFRSFALNMRDRYQATSIMGKIFRWILNAFGIL